MLINMVRICFDALLTFLALRWSLEMGRQEKFFMLLRLKRSGCIRTKALLAYSHGQFAQSKYRVTFPTKGASYVGIYSYPRRRVVSGA
jgi:hypothetical protein